MTTLSKGSIRLPAAGFGSLNPLPPLTRLDDPHDGKAPEVDDAEMLEAIGYGHLESLLPYLLQDGYDRTLVERSVPVAVLQNEVLRATFLVGLGGRLWSLVHLPTGRELLHRNAVLQPANLGLRNAWFAGGVEWNLGTTGHTTLTCDPLHASRVDGPDGEPVLRLHEYERTRGLVQTLDFSLPPGSPVLLVSGRVTNPGPDPMPLYWWSNIAVPESDDVRVVAPADTAYHYDYERGLHVVPVPGDGRDVTYPATAPRPADWFFDCRAAERPWIAALDGEGRGLVHTSTHRLVGRKLFVWGSSTGGRNWQEFLSGPGERYLEIQGGLARTQFEHEPLPASDSVTWLEAYGLAEVDPVAARGPWAGARNAVEVALGALAPAELLEAELARAEARADAAPAELLSPGSGWGALEERRRRADGEPPLAGPGTPFPESTLTAEQEPWVSLLDTGAVPAADPSTAPPSYVVGEAWRARLEDAPDTWLSWLHRGVARWHAGDAEGARDATERSARELPTTWSLRNLAIMARAAADPAAAVRHYEQAHALAPGLRPLLVERLEALLEADRAPEVLTLIDALPAPDRAVGRMRLLELRAAVASGELDRAGALFEGDLVVDDMREGEDSFAALWERYHHARGTVEVPPMPAHLDFRMS